MKTVSVIIVNWNGLHWLQGCLPTLSKQTHTALEIIVVDNGSTDGSVSWVRKHYPKAKVIVNAENLGFSHANNIGYKKATGSYVLFLNNDTKTTRTFIARLVQVLESDRAIGGAQSKILLMDKPDTHDSVGAFLTPTGFLYHYGFGKKNIPKYDAQIDLYTAKGACMIFKKSVLKKVEVDGWILDPDYFAYFEESDMCHRILLAGYRIVYVHDSVIYHKMGATSSSMNNDFIQYHSFKNRIRSYIKNLSLLSALFILPVHLLLCEAFSLASLAKGKFALAVAIQKSIFWNISHIGDSLRMRAYIQKTVRKIPDSQYFSRVMKRPSIRYYLSLSRGEISEET